MSTDGVTLEYIDNSVDSFNKAKEVAFSLMDSSISPKTLNDAFNSKDLASIETSIVKLNEFANKCWLISSILLYSIVYDKQLYQQSGLSWEQYKAESKKRLGMSKDDISRSLTSAKFFIRYHDALLRAGWTPQNSSFKFSFAQQALELSGSLDETIKHLVSDSFREFRAWYGQFRAIPAIEIKDVRPDIEITNHNIKINGINAVTISDELPNTEKENIEYYLEQIFTALKRGEVPAIVPVYDEKEAKNLINLRDKYRQKK